MAATAARLPRPVSANSDAERARNWRRDDASMTHSSRCDVSSLSCRQSLFGRDGGLPLGFGHAVAPPQPLLQPVEIEIDDRRRVEREQLAQREAADHGVAKRLAQLRSGAGAKR